MKHIIILLAATLGCSAREYGNFLNIAILTIPPKYVANMPIGDRPKLLVLTSEDSDDWRLDYEHGWLTWCSDGGCHVPPEKFPRADCMFWLKLLHRADGSPLVFIHVPKASHGGGEPVAGQTHILERRQGAWHDITDVILPGKVDRSGFFLPQRSQEVIQCGRYEKVERRDGKGFTYKPGQRLPDLVWHDGEFSEKMPEGDGFSYGYDHRAEALEKTR